MISDDASIEGSGHKRATYQVLAERVGDSWAIHSLDVGGALSQCSEVSEIEMYAKAAIARVLDCDVDDFDVQIIHEPL